MVQIASLFCCSWQQTHWTKAQVVTFLTETLPFHWCFLYQSTCVLLTATACLLDTWQSNTHTTILLLFWNMSGTTRVSRYQKGKTRKVKTNLDLLEQEIVSGSGICWAIYAMLTPFNLQQGLPLRATHGFTSHSTHPQSSSLHGAVKAGSLPEIQKRALPPPCFPSFNFQSTRSQGATLALLPPVLT